MLLLNCRALDFESGQHLPQSAAEDNPLKHLGVCLSIQSRQYVQVVQARSHAMSNMPTGNRQQRPSNMHLLGPPETMCSLVRQAFSICCSRYEILILTSSA